MDDPISSPNASDLDRRIIAGWAAIEHGDLGEARAALSDVYAVDEAHPGLPLLAAAIRRTRPKPVPWRSTLLVLIVIAGGAFVVYSMMTSPVRHVASTARATSAPASSDDEAAPVVADSVGTSGKRANGQAPAESSQTQRSQEALRSSGSDEAMIRQGIARFATAYSNRFKPVAFTSCDVARGDDSATVTCQARGADPSDEAGDGTWIFTCRKAADAWKIVSIQPPAE